MTKFLGIWAVHLLTASGAGFALVAAVAAADRSWQMVFLFLGFAMIVDGVDGPIARRLARQGAAALVRRGDPRSGGRFHHLRAGPGAGSGAERAPQPALCHRRGIVVAVVGALYFADTRMKTAEQAFRGFPAVWNAVVFQLMVYKFPEAVTLLIIAAFAVLTFLPVEFVHPMRVTRLRPLTFAMSVAWGLSGLRRAAREPQSRSGGAGHLLHRQPLLRRHRRLPPGDAPEGDDRLGARTMSLLQWIADPAILASFVTLTVMEIVLGIDNIIFISVIVGRLPPEQSKHARQLGLALALVFRIALLSLLFWLIHLSQPLFEIAGHPFSVRDLVLLAGGFFLLVKATSEIHKDVECGGEEEGEGGKAGVSFGMIVSQIILIDIVFSVNSIITAIGMAEHIGVMIAAVVVAVAVMYAASGAIARFISRHPTTRMLALSFLLMIGFALVADGIGFHIPRAYLYTAMAFSAGVEVLNVVAAAQPAKEEGMNAPHRPPVAAAGGWFTPPRLIMAVFFVQAVAMTNWFPRIPDVQQRLGLGPGELSICMLAMSLGTFVMTVFNGPLIARYSARTMMAIGMCIFYATMILPGLAWNGPSLFAFLFLMGLAYVIVDVAMNVEAARIQDAVGRRIMSTCHGFWSIGAVVGSVMGAQFAEASVPTWLHLLIVAVAVLPLGLAPVRALPVIARTEAPATGRRPLITFPTLALAGVCIYVFGAVLAELGARNWGAAFLRDTLGTSAAATGWGLGAFSFTMALGRLAGDRLADRFGPVTLGRVCAFTGVAGMVALVLRQRPADGARRLRRHRLRCFRRLPAGGHRCGGAHRPAGGDQRRLGGAHRLQRIAGRAAARRLRRRQRRAALRPRGAAAADGAERAVCRLACPGEGKERRYRRLSLAHAFRSN